MRPDAYDIKQRIGIVMANVLAFKELWVDENGDHFCGLYVKDAAARRQLVDERLTLSNWTPEILPEETCGIVAQAEYSMHCPQAGTSDTR